jgi:amino acid transporter
MMSAMPSDDPPSSSSANVRRVVGRAGFFALSFGSIVGSGWIILLGEWLRLAAPGGALLALLAGGVLMATVGACYAELAARMPRAGGEFLYALESFGPRPAFIVGWFFTLFLVAICAFEGTALAWLSVTLIPAAQGAALYHVLGNAVTVDSLVLGLIGAVAVCALNLKGVQTSVLFQRVVTYGFLAVMLTLIVAGLAFGTLHNLQPMFEPPAGRSWMVGSLWIFATCAMLLNGFQAALHVIEERAPDVTVGAATLRMVLGIIGAAVFYAAVVLAAGSILPWRKILSTELPAVAAFDALHASGGTGKIILCAAILSLAKTWNAVVLMASRMILAQARAGVLPVAFSRLDGRTGAPSNAIWLVTAASVAGMVLGRGALVPIINMATICVAMTLVLSLVILLRLRHQRIVSPGFSVPGGTATIVLALIGVSLMAAYAFCEPLLRDPHGIPLEWTLMAAWAVLGLLLSRFTDRHGEAATALPP